MRLLTALVVCGVIALQFSFPARSQSQQDRSPVDPTTLERDAVAAREGDLYQMSILVRHTLNFAHIVPLPANIRQTLEEHLSTAEVDFWNHSHAGVQEGDIVRLINRACDRLQLPEYAKTNQAQVRELRMDMLVHFPTLMGRGMADYPMKVGDSISPVLSPLQAMHLVSSLIDQKFLDPAYQVTPDEWSRQTREERLAMRRTLINPKSPDHVALHEKRIAHRRQLEATMVDGLRQMSPTDEMNMLAESLEIWGIDK
jgi:hypothetical protein